MFNYGKIPKGSINLMWSAVPLSYLIYLAWDPHGNLPFWVLPRMRIILAAFWRFRCWVFTFQTVFPSPPFFYINEFVMHRLGFRFPFRFAPFVLLFLFKAPRATSNICWHNCQSVSFPPRWSISHFPCRICLVIRSIWVSFFLFFWGARTAAAVYAYLCNVCRGKTFKRSWKLIKIWVNVPLQVV